MFDFTSRYYAIENATYVTETGLAVMYKRRRFLPDGNAMPLLAEVALHPHERLDLFAHRTLGDPLQFWRICDANEAMSPFELMGSKRLRVPVPQP